MVETRKRVIWRKQTHNWIKTDKVQFTKLWDEWVRFKKKNEFICTASNSGGNQRALFRAMLNSGTYEIYKMKMWKFSSRNIRFKLTYLKHFHFEIILDSWFAKIAESCKFFGLTQRLRDKESVCNAEDTGDMVSIPGLKRSWRKKWQLIPVF